MDKRTLRRFDELCLTRVEPFDSQAIRELRKNEGVSQAVLARYLNVNASVWRRLLGLPRRFDISPAVPWSRYAPSSRAACRRVTFMASAASVTLNPLSQTLRNVSARSSSRLLIFNTVIRHLDPESARGGSPVGHL